MLPRRSRVREVAKRIIQAAGIAPLQREMNLHPGRFEWEINVFDSRKINAFLPARREDCGVPRLNPGR